MTFGEYKANGGTWDYKVYANDAGSFGHAGSTIYGDPSMIDDWEIASISIKTDNKLDNAKVTIALIFPHK